MPESDRDILIELRAKVTDIHFNMMQPGGKVPMLQSRVDEHSSQISAFSGGMKTLAYILAGLGVLLTAFGGVLLAHILGGK